MTFCSLERVVMILVEDLTIVSQREIAPRIFEMVLKGEMVADMQVGQFVHLKVPDPSKLLRRPISISEIDYDKKEATIVYRVEREGTAILSKMVAGQTIDTMGPQGNGFDNFRCRCWGGKPSSLVEVLVCHLWLRRLSS